MTPTPCDFDAALELLTLLSTRPMTVASLQSTLRPQTTIRVAKLVKQLRDRGFRIEECQLYGDPAVRLNRRYSEQAQTIADHYWNARNPE